MSARKKSQSRKPERVKAGGGDVDLSKNRVQGNQVGGNKINVENVSRSAVAIGAGARANLSQGLGGDEVARLFDALYEGIKARPEDPDVPKAELTETVKKIEEENALGDQANPNKVERWLKTLAMMAPDIFEVAVATLTSPVAGVAAVIRKVAEKAKEEGSKA